MKAGKAIIQYKRLLGYERGADGKPKIIPDQAETIRFIYQRYLAGDTLRSLKAQLEADGVPYITGEAVWNISGLQSILQNEKYCGDVLLQKTFIKDCISKKVIKNTGQLPKVLIQNHHEPIISREIFDAVQEETARRNAAAASTKKSAPTGLGKYSGKHALTGVLVCGAAGASGHKMTRNAPCGDASAAWTTEKDIVNTPPPSTKNRSNRPFWPL